MELSKTIKPGLFSHIAHADTRRDEFDVKNECIVVNNIPVQYVFIGDSITHNFETEAYFYGNGIVINRGIGGDSTEYLLKRFEADVIQLKPLYAIILIGINDTWILDDIMAPNNSPEDIKIKVISNMNKILEICKEKKQKTIIGSLLPTFIPGNPHNKERNEMILEINAELEKLCYREAQIYVNYHEGFVAADGVTLRQGLCDDGLHPNVMGYNIMVDILRKTLMKNDINI